jgi:chromosome segregation ATPase
MIDVGSIRELISELGGLEESLKAERGRITITQAELETVETRLRELEEIERELEASAIETKEELNILKKKEKELRSKNDELKQRIAEATGGLEKLLSEVELSSQAQEQMTAMQTELLATQEKIDVLILQIEQGNEQYFILKKRYDALDIEYAQLYEKFSLTQDANQDDDE